MAIKKIIIKSQNFFSKALRKLWLKFRMTRWNPAVAALHYEAVTASVHKAIEKKLKSDFY